MLQSITGHYGSGLELNEELQTGYIGILYQMNYKFCNIWYDLFLIDR